MLVSSLINLLEHKNTTITLYVIDGESYDGKIEDMTEFHLSCTIKKIRTNHDKLYLLIKKETNFKDMISNLGLTDHFKQLGEIIVGLANKKDTFFSDKDHDLQEKIIQFLEEFRRAAYEKWQLPF